MTGVSEIDNSLMILLHQRTLHDRHVTATLSYVSKGIKLGAAAKGWEEMVNDEAFVEESSPVVVP